MLKQSQATYEVGEMASSNKPVSGSECKGKKGVKIGGIQDINHTELRVSLDKISVTLTGLKQEELDDVVKNIRLCAMSPDKEDFMPVFRGKYHAQIRIRATVTDNVLLQAAPKNKIGAQMRLEWNPAKIGADGHEKLKVILEGMLPYGYEQLLAHGLVTRCDIAIDAHGASPDELSFFSKRPAKFSHFNNKGVTETVYLGTKTCKKRWVVYDKAKQLKMQAGSKITRFEMRNLKQDFPLANLAKMESPLDGLTVTTGKVGTKHPEGIGKETWGLFRSLCHHVSQQEALSRLEKSNRKIARQHLRKTEQKWWKTEELWKQWQPHIEEIGILKSLHKTPNLVPKPCTVKKPTPHTKV